MHWKASLRVKPSASIKGVMTLEINVLGTMYSIRESNELDDPRLQNCDGYCDDTSKTLVVNEMTMIDPMSKDDLGEYKKLVTRHELVHAFLFESGLSEMSSDETLVEWIAYQFPKMLKAFQKAECL